MYATFVRFSPTDGGRRGSMGEMKQNRNFRELFECEPDRLNILYVEWDTTACIYFIRLLAANLHHSEHHDIENGLSIYIQRHVRVSASI